MQKAKQEPSKANSQFQHPLPRQWLRPYLFALSDMFDGRWSYWLKTIENGKPLDVPIPKIDFDSRLHPDTKKNIKDCIRFIQSKGHGSPEAWNSLIDGSCGALEHPYKRNGQQESRKK